MSRQSVAKAHQKIQELAWEPQYHEPVSQYGTDYTFPKAQKKDPLKQVLRSYFPMQEEKDNRVYGAQDGAIRGNMFRQVQERWLEWQKLFLSIIPLPEISAARAMPLLFRTVPNPELHNGQAIQMIDEVRHSTIQQNLKRLYMNNYIDPAGFNSSLRNFQNDYCGTIGRQFAEGFITGDAITAASIYLTIVAETAFTNTLFVAMPAEAAANGDYLLPTVFHSVQSDESRHISNGYATLLMALADESNHQLLERDLRYAWWNNHRVVDAAIGTFIEYGTKDRRKDRESYAEMWRRWIYDDYYRSYLVPLEKYGLVIPHDLIEEAWNQIWNKGYVHEVAQFFATGWLANYWRIDPMTDKDFEWFEYKYPGWYDKYGKWWENYNRLSMPNGHHPIVAEDVDYVYPHRCWTCMVPCLVREDMVMDEVDGQWRTYCHEECRWTDAVAFRPTYQGRQTPNMGQLIGKREWETLYHGWNWADVVSDMGYVRDDGKTMVAQPHLNLDPKKMWTLDHLRRMGPGAEPERPAQRDDGRAAAGIRRRLQPAGPGGPPGPRGRLVRPGREGAARPAAPSRTSLPACRPLADPSPAQPGKAQHSPATREGGHVREARRPVRAGRHRDRGRRGTDHPAGRCRAGHHAHARLQGRAVRVLQVVHPRRRGHRARQVLHVRAARLRARGRLHAAVPGACLRGRHDRAAQLRRGDDPLRPAHPAGRGGSGVEGRRHPRHAAPGPAADRTGRDQVLPRPVHGHRDPGNGGGPVVLDGEHLQPRERAARVHHQGLPGRPVLPVPGREAGRRRPA